MELDISFMEDVPEAASLESERLASVPEFLNFVFVLGMVVDLLHDPDVGQEGATCLHEVTNYADQHPQADERFCSYLSFLSENEEATGAEVIGSLDPFAYHPLALRLATAMMLRDDPVTGAEACEILPFAKPLCTFARHMAGMMKIGAEDSSLVHQGDAMVKVFEKYLRCLEVAAARDVAFVIGF